MSGPRARLRTVPGILGAGAAVGALATVLLVGARLWIESRPAPDDEPVTSAGVTPPGAEPPGDLAARNLLFPVPAAPRSRVVDTFEDARGAGRRVHHALDILAPRNSPVLSADEGSVIRLDDTGAGGITVYATDPSRRFCYYYAHLQRRADGIHEGVALARGEVLGYVGTTGNAPASTPHLHFAISDMAGGTDCWKGRAIDPYPLFAGAR